MKLRLARKIVARMESGREYRETTLNAAVDRVDQCDRRLRAFRTWWRQVPVGAMADALVKLGAPGQAFNALMRAEESRW